VGSSPQGTLTNKESPRDFVGNTRKIFYTEKAIIAKKEETEKLKEYVVMEHERLAEAKRIFNDDKLRFEKYVNEQEIDMANTKDRAEKAYDERLKVALQVRNLQEEIEKIETEIRQVSEKADEYRSAKDFVEIVITENKTLSSDIKNLLKQ
jgi:chromosome segregation ATPase